MKGKDIITHAVRAEMPDMEQLKEKCIQQAVEKTTVKRAVWAKRLIPAAVCLIVVLAAVIAFPRFIGGSENNPPIDTSMRGLTVENFNLADAIKGGAMMDRMVFTDFGSLFEFGTDCFAVVRITDTEIKKTLSDSPFDKQVSDAYVLQNIYNERGSNTLQVIQSVITDHFCLGTTNLLREGGVYLLPLGQYDGKWYVMGDMDFLFEVDYTGKVWSHSDFEDFNRYDGKSIEYLIDELKIMISDEDFMLANSRFSSVLKGWTLADITIVNKSDEKKDEYGEYFNYTFTVHEILFDPSRGNGAPIKESERIRVYADETDEIELLPQKRYLIFLDRHGGEIDVNSWMNAEIGSDETIAVRYEPDNQSNYEESVFKPYDGYTLLQMRELVSRIEAWRETHN